MEQFEKVCKGLEKLDGEAYSRWVHCPYTQDVLIKGIGDYVQPAIALIRQQQERIKELEACEKRFAEWAKRNSAHVCATCGRASHNRPHTTACPIEEHYAVPLDGGCHLWEKP